MLIKHYEILDIQCWYAHIKPMTYQVGDFYEVILTKRMNVFTVTTTDGYTFGFYKQYLNFEEANKQFKKLLRG
ncbi:MAG TPA: hypothetical protein VI911_08670 [Patescibacteria group bacterium]|nr:MAG: hypothetical protein UR43_C0005G0098 [candidate division TM6 bacterium GW2011_GWF2_33_332]HLD91069.1 hypothetical protein [Patescibacteria group bacterium]